MRAPVILAALLALAACSPSGTPMERGRAALAQGDLGTARVESMNSVKQAPRSGEARILLARVHLARGDGVAAESELLRARQLGVADKELAHLLAHARWLRGDPRRALSWAAAAAPPFLGYAARIQGNALSDLDDPVGAAAAFDRALSLDREDPAVWTDLGRFRRRNGDVGGAIEAADQAVAADGRHVPALVLRGELTRGQYGLAAALPWFERALSVDPTSIPALIERATTLGELGRMKEMLADTREIHRISGGHPRAWFLQAALAARAGNFPLAQTLYRRTGGQYDASPAGMLMQGAIDFGNGNVEQAARRLRELVERQPGNRKARRLLAATLWRTGDSAGVIAVLRPIVDRADADAYSLALIGRALMRSGDEASASSYLARAARPSPDALSAPDPLSDADFAAAREAAQANPGHGPTEVRLISALLARGQSGEALERARRLQAANPGAPEAHVLTGDAVGMTGNFAEAAEHYQRAANISFSEATALRLIEALQRSGQTEAAGRVLDLFVSQNPRNVPSQILLAGRHMQAQRWPEAIALYESLRSRLGDNEATILNNLAWAYSETGNYRSAIPLARRAWQLDRNNPATTDTLGWILFKSGADRAGGLALLEQAARGAPSDVEIRRRLSEARRSESLPS